jgi:hypothetical protein
MPEALGNFLKLGLAIMGLMALGVLVYAGYWISLVVAGRMLDARERKRADHATRKSEKELNDRASGDNSRVVCAFSGVFLRIIAKKA